MLGAYLNVASARACQPWHHRLVVNLVKFINRANLQAIMDISRRRVLRFAALSGVPLISAACGESSEPLEARVAITVPSHGSATTLYQPNPRPAPVPTPKINFSNFSPSDVYFLVEQLPPGFELFGIRGFDLVTNVVHEDGLQPSFKVYGIPSECNPEKCHNPELIAKYFAGNHVMNLWMRGKGGRLEDAAIVGIRLGQSTPILEYARTDEAFGYMADNQPTEVEFLHTLEERFPPDKKLSRDALELFTSFTSIPTGMEQHYLFSRHLAEAFKFVATSVVSDVTKKR